MGTDIYINGVWLEEVNNSKNLRANLAEGGKQISTRGSQHQGEAMAGQGLAVTASGLQSPILILLCGHETSIREHVQVV